MAGAVDKRSPNLVLTPWKTLELQRDGSRCVLTIQDANGWILISSLKIRSETGLFLARQDLGRNISMSDLVCMCGNENNDH